MRGSLLRSAVLFGSLALGGSLLATAASAVSWDDYALGSFYDISQATDPAVRTASHAVVFFGNASGFLISPEGHVLTNYHVYQTFGNAGTVYVEWTSRGYVRQLTLSLVVARADYDMALYQANVTNTPYLPIDASAPFPGEDVFAVGHPNGKSQEVSYGRVLATGHVLSGRPSIEYSTQTWWGSSGSPICNRAGNVVALHWGWDQDHVSTGRLAGIPFNLMAQGVPEIAQIAAAYGAGAGAVARSSSVSTSASGAGTASAARPSSATLPIGGSARGTLAGTGALTYLRCDLVTRGDLTIDLEGPANADFDLAVWKWNFGTSRGATVAASNGSTSSERVVLRDTAPGTYIVAVSSYRGAGDFAMSAALTHQSAVGGGAPATTSGFLSGTNAWRLFQLDTPGGMVSVALDGPDNTDFDVYVFAGTQVTANALVAKGDTTSSHERVVFDAAAGHYTLLVRSANGAGRFSLGVR